MVIGEASVQRSAVIYVGRFARSKKVDLLVEAFGRAVARGLEADLILVGAGELDNEISRIVDSHGIESRVLRPGWIVDPTELGRYYARSFVSVSPGFAGLGLTQSLGYGVPSLVSRDEPHSPEIELADIGGVTFFETDNADSLAIAIRMAWASRAEVPLTAVHEYVAANYSAESMCAGLSAALTGNDLIGV